MQATLRRWLVIRANRRHIIFRAGDHLTFSAHPPPQKAYQELIADIDAGNAVSLDKVLQIGLQYFPEYLPSAGMDLSMSQNSDA